MGITKGEGSDCANKDDEVDIVHAWLLIVCCLTCEYPSTLPIPFLFPSYSPLIFFLFLSCPLPIPCLPLYPFQYSPFFHA